MNETIVEPLADDLDYTVTTEAPYGSIAPARITRRVSGADGVHRAFAEIIRDGVQLGRYQMHTGADGVLESAMKAKTAQIEEISGELQAAIDRFHELKSGNALTQPLAEQQVKVMQLQAQAQQYAQEAVTLAETQQVGQILLVIAGQVDKGIFDPTAPLVDEESDENPTFGAFAEGFIAATSHPKGPRRDWNIDVTVRPVG